KGLRRGESAGERGSGEERDADEEEAPIAEEIAEPPCEQKEAAEGHEIGVDDPGERRGGESQICPDRRQRDIHDGGVEHHHQIAKTKHHQRDPASAAVDCHHSDSLNLAGQDRARKRAAQRSKRPQRGSWAIFRNGLVSATTFAVRPTLYLEGGGGMW